MSHNAEDWVEDSIHSPEQSFQGSQNGRRETPAPIPFFLRLSCWSGSQAANPCQRALIARKAGLVEVGNIAGCGKEKGSNHKQRTDRRARRDPACDGCAPGDGLEFEHKGYEFPLDPVGTVSHSKSIAALQRSESAAGAKRSSAPFENYAGTITAPTEGADRHLDAEEAWNAMAPMALEAALLLGLAATNSSRSTASLIAPPFPGSRSRPSRSLLVATALCSNRMADGR